MKKMMHTAMTTVMTKMMQGVKKVMLAATAAALACGLAAAAPMPAMACDGGYSYVSSYNNYYIFQGSDYRYLTSADVSGMSADQLQMGINEIYARHGRLFNDSSIQAYFNSQSWYYGYISPSAFNESVFNDYENANIAFLARCKKSAPSYSTSYTTYTTGYTCSGYIIPGSDCRYLSYSDISGMSSYQLQMAINEIYARHGRLFNDSSIQAYFNSQSWYYGYISPSAFNESVFNDYENANIAFLAAHK